MSAERRPDSPLRTLHSALTFLVDVDNTLLDNDAIKRDLQETVVATLGRAHGDRFWAVYEHMRQEHDFVDFPATIARFRLEHPEATRVHDVTNLLENLPFERYLYPGALATLAALGRLGTVAILSDGDTVYQPGKITRSGLAAAVEGRVLIYAHKEQHLHEVQQRYPADHYVLVDDKPNILAAAKRVLDAALTTVLVCQGQYAHSAALPDYHPAADRVAATIADVGQQAPEWFGGGPSPP